MSPANADSAAMCRDDRTGYPYIAYISGTGNGTELCLSYWDEVQTRWSAVTVDSQVGDINLLWRQVSCAFDASTSTLGIAYLRMVKIPDYNLMSTIALKLYVRLRDRFGSNTHQCFARRKQSALQFATVDVQTDLASPRQTRRRVRRPVSVGTNSHFGAVISRTVSSSLWPTANSTSHGINQIRIRRHPQTQAHGFRRVRIKCGRQA